METLVQLLLAFMAVFIILLVLVQRGRGGGLVGALGGPGGSSAFGAKAGDTFTKITIYSVVFWIVACVLASYWASHRGDAFGTGDGAFATGNAAEATSDLGGTEAGDLGALETGGAADAAAAESSADTGAETGAEPSGDE